MKSMTIDEAHRRMVARMTPSERAIHEQGCQIVDFYMDIAMNSALPDATRTAARDALRAFAFRKSGETVVDVDGRAKQ